jgi:hypothetical protein
MARAGPAHITPLGRHASPPASERGSDGHTLRQHLLSHWMPVAGQGHQPNRGAHGGAMWYRSRMGVVAQQAISQSHPHLSTGNGGHTAWAIPKRILLQETDENKEKLRASTCARPLDVWPRRNAVDFLRRCDDVPDLQLRRVEFCKIGVSRQPAIHQATVNKEAHHGVQYVSADGDRGRVMGARHGRIVTNAVRSPMRPATR